MAVRVSTSRKLVLIEWDEDVKGDTVDIRGVNPDDPDDPSWREASNDGHSAAISFPAGYSGTVELTVTGDEGTSDTGTITV